MPATSPPPPIGTKIASGGSESWRRISMPMLPCPAITSGSSNGWMKVSPRSRAISRACSQAWSKSSPCSCTSPPRSSTACTLIAGVVCGMTITAGMPRRRAASATPWAWLPAEAQITPRFATVSDRCAILL